MVVLDRGQQLLEIALHVRDLAGRAVVEVLVGVFAVAGGAQTADRELLAGQVPRDEHDLAGAAYLTGGERDGGEHAPGAVAEEERQVLAGIPPLNLADQERLRDLTSVRKFPHFHGFTKLKWPAGGNLRRHRHAPPT